MTDIRKKAQLVALQVSSWGGQKVDRSVSIATCQSQNADRKSGSFVKKLVPPEALKPRGRAVNALREFINHITLPWDRGRRLLPNQSYMKNLPSIDKHIQTVNDCTNTFLNDYASWEQAGKAQLGNMYDPGDYPSIPDLRQRFSIDLEFEPIPRKEHFLLDMQQATVDEIAAKAEKVVSKRMQEAQQSVWTGLLEVTSHFADVMAQPDKRFKSSTLTNLLDTLEVAPSLNLEDDPVLNDVVTDIRTCLKGLDADQLRKNPLLRKTAANAGTKIVGEIEQILEMADAV